MNEDNGDSELPETANAAPLWISGALIVAALLLNGLVAVALLTNEIAPQ
jgi:hypothetical protein